MTSTSVYLALLRKGYRGSEETVRRQAYSVSTRAESPKSDMFMREVGDLGDLGEER